ncbi:MAG: c-type cytochrome [Acidobacteriia bacterium]|nr:c-type cytochrome [Terriglobia bacterium]
MTAEKMGTAPKRLRLAFAVGSVLFLAGLAVSPLKDLLREWKQYRSEYARFAESRSDTRVLLADFHSGVDQIWIPELGVTDRCITCHQGITQPSLLDPSVPEPFRAHALIPHQAKEWGCVVCHRGQGLATEVREAHETTKAWERPLLPVSYMQASCGVCHRAGIPETPRLNRGRDLLVELNCVGCHRLQDIERPTMLGPELTDVGTKVTRRWIYKWLKEPRTTKDSNGNVTADGYENEEEPRMPQFRLSENEIRGLSAYLISLKSKPIETYKFNPQVVAVLEKKPDLVDQGQIRFRQMFCTTCHSIAVTRAGETQLIGGKIGPELTKVGSKVDSDWLVAWLRNPQAHLPHALMPRYRWSDEDLYVVTRYITTSLTDPDLLSDVPKLGAPGPQEIQLGKRLFVEKGCSSCHLVAGTKPQTDFGPDLTNVGRKTVSQLEFGTSSIPRTLVAYIQAKVGEPTSVNPSARMPQYHFETGDLEAVTTALLSMTGRLEAPGLTALVVPAARTEFRPAGEFAALYERYKCYVCHRFNGFGSTLAPDLSDEGSRAQRKWLISFLRNPQTLRPTLTFRMPQFNITEEEAATIADYLLMVMQSPAVDIGSVDLKSYTPQMATLGKQLYEVKYQCQSCHTIGSTGGYVGPNLNNAGNWLNAAWIAAWLKDPQALVPGTIEPEREFTDQELQALTAYLLTLRQNPQAGGTARTAGATGGTR